MQEKVRMNQNETKLLTLIRNLTGQQKEDIQIDDELISLARKQATSVLVIDQLKTPSESQLDQERSGVFQYYHLLFETRKYAQLLNNNDIPCVVLKGAALSRFYPIPEFRKSGDVDLLIKNKEDMDKARKLLLETGAMISSQQHAFHHLVFHIGDGIELELHTEPAEDMENAKANQVMEEAVRTMQIQNTAVIGHIIPIPDYGHEAYYALLHMLQHFLHEGFGLKLLADWTFMWNAPHAEEEINTYRKLINQTGITGFSDMVTTVCVTYLGLNKEKGNQILFNHDISEKNMINFLNDIFEAGDFGRSQNNRMLILKDTGFKTLVKEFHHQMTRNYPKSSKLIITWPALWISTLVIFLKNNKKLRNTNTRKIIVKAKERSTLLKDMKLFQ